ncbi:YraN family protein [Aliidiomarina taiwanensis]|uniref:UPF0102 protein CWE15_05595 n=1 Tax=Aliidiomarina taiwanensis TaxID=946228 RepID=A0A432X7W5_9GAMM|nr:YraN family protein [Aliidiomarina taiwanensis]RUO42877.1 YraN family protein [Aliidiomarina taiwanensis]
MSTRALGTKQEDTALRFLTQQGLRLLARNYRLRDGEIDLIMYDQAYLVFIEVKYRKNGHFADILEQIDQRQLVRIRRSARIFMHQHGMVEHQTLCRFDVVAITGQPFHIEWLKDAF